MWPSNKASHEVSPQLHITEPMPAGEAQVTFKLRGEKEARTWSGIGGHNRIWSSHDWFSVVKGWHNARAKVGPYVLSVFEDVAKVDGKRRQGTVLFKDAEPVMRSNLEGWHNTSSQGSTGSDADYHLITRRYDGKLHSNWGETSTGWTLDFVSPSAGKHWQFILEHRTLPFEVDLGGGKGLAGFTELVSGGEVNGEQYQDGCGVSEQVFLPDSMSLKLMLSIWWQLVTGSGTSPLKAVWQMVSAPFR
jgi:hypothetical protein